MADPEQRERESEESDVTKFEEADARDADERHDAAERLREDPPPEPREDESA